MQELQFAIVAVDIFSLTIHNGEPYFRTIHVDGSHPHFANWLALPGGVIRVSETAEEAAVRILKDKAKLETQYIEQLHTYSACDRDPRGRVISIAHVTYHRDGVTEENATQWHPWSDTTLALAYDHTKIRADAIQHVRKQFASTTIAKHLLPETFTLTELENLYASVMSEVPDRRNFRKKVLALDILQELTEKRSEGRMRPARLYRFKSAEVSLASIL